MDVITLGTGTLVPEAARASAAVVVVDGSHVLPIDLGRNSLSRMVECGLDPLTLDDFLLTHLHPDHSCELVSLLFALNYAVVPPRTRPLRIWGPRGLGDLVDGLQEAWEWLKPRYPLDVVEIGPGPVAGLPFDVEAVRLEHGNTENLGYRVRSARSERSIAFTGDTGPCEGLVELAAGVDLLVAECADSDSEPTPFHLSPTALGVAAQRACVGQLVITHLYPGLEPGEVLAGVCAEYSGRVALGRDGMRFRV